MSYFHCLSLKVTLDRRMLFIGKWKTHVFVVIVMILAVLSGDFVRHLEINAKIFVKMQMWVLCAGFHNL